MILSFWHSYSLSAQNLLSFLISYGDEPESKSTSGATLLSGPGFFFLCPPGAAVFSRERVGCLVATRPSPGNHVYTHSWSGPGLGNMAAQGTCSTSPSNVSPTSVSQPGPPPTPPPTSTAISKFPVESKASSLSPLPRSTCREDLLPLAVFYGPLDAKNPLLASCEKEIQELLGFMKRKTALATTEEQEHEFHRRW